MSTEKKVAMLRAMMDEEEEEDSGVLEAFLELAKQKILNRMYQFGTDGEYDGLDVPDKYVMTQLNIAIYYLDKRGAEGEIQHIENGIHRNYGAADVPDGMLAEIVPYCQVIR